jgi:hypothetical protein
MGFYIPATSSSSRFSTPNFQLRNQNKNLVVAFSPVHGSENLGEAATKERKAQLDSLLNRLDVELG